MSAAGKLPGTPLPRRYKPGDDDFFIEPAWAVDLLLDAEQFDGILLDRRTALGPLSIAAGTTASERKGRRLSTVAAFLPGC